MQLISPVYAHEAYVLPKEEFQSELKNPPNFQALDALKKPYNLETCLYISVGVTLLLIAYFLFRKTRVWKSIKSFTDQHTNIGLLAVRLAISVSLLASSLTNSFLGPELSLSSLPYSMVIRVVLFLAGICFLLGRFTRIAAAASLIVFLIGFLSFGSYLITYFNYLGEFVALVLFGSAFIKDKEKYQTLIVRICYGIALAFAAYNIKFLHSVLTIDVVKIYNLIQFHLLFPSDPLLVAFGAALAELAIGIFIILGFATRLTVLISLFYITLSLLYFQEAVWPHLMLYGISFNLLLSEEYFSLDNLVDRFLKIKR